MKTTVWITTSFIGFHCWPNAPERAKHLRETHRHKFNVRAEVHVYHTDRDIEFQILKLEIDDFLSRLAQDMSCANKSTLSCEQIARQVYFQINRVTDNKVMSVSVDEDGECGATLYP